MTLNQGICWGLGILVILVAGILTIDSIRNRRYWRFRCTTCKVKYPSWDGFRGILHGMGSESDCWEEHICPSCGARDNPQVGGLTRHALWPEEFN